MAATHDKSKEKSALEKMADEFEDTARRIRAVSGIRKNHTNSDTREAVAQTWERAASELRNAAAHANPQ